MTIGKKYKIKEDASKCEEHQITFPEGKERFRGDVFTCNSLTYNGNANYQTWSWCEHMVEEVKGFKPGDRVKNASGIRDVVKLVPGMEEYDIMRYGYAERGMVLKKHDWVFQERWKLDEPTKADIQVGQTYRFVGKEQNCGMCGALADPHIKIKDTDYNRMGWLRYEIYSGGKLVGACYGCDMRAAIERGDWVLCEPTTYKVGDRVGMYEKTTSRSEQATVIEVNEDGIRIRFDEGLYSDPDGVWYDPEGIYPLPLEDDLRQRDGVEAPDIREYVKQPVEPILEINQNKSMSVVNFIKDQALKLTNPHEFNLRKAGLHSDCGTLTSDGKEAIWTFIEELPEIKAKLGKLAEDMIAQEEAK